MSELLGTLGSDDGWVPHAATTNVKAMMALSGRPYMMVENIPSMEERQSSAGPERDATAAEARALAHPLRLRILRLCIDSAMTNRELAHRLDRDPGTVLYHVRRLVTLGFLKAEPMRRGSSGHLEQPYRITGKSWMLRITQTPTYAVAALEATRDEVMEAGARAALSAQRLGVRLTVADRRDLVARLEAIGSEFAARDDETGEQIGLFLLVHRRKG